MINIYTKIDNKILSVIYSSKLTASQIKILLFVFRQTSGYHQNSRRLSAGYISLNTNIAPRYVKDCLKTLVSYNVLKKSGTQSKANVIEINFDVSSWKIKSGVIYNARCATDHRNSELQITNNSELQITNNSELQITHINKDNKEIYKEKYKEYDEYDNKSKSKTSYKNRYGNKNKPSVFSSEGRSYDLEAYANSSIFD